MKKTLVLFLAYTLFSTKAGSAQTWIWDTVVYQSLGEVSLHKDQYSRIYAVNQASNTVSKINSDGVPQWHLVFPAYQNVKSICVSPDSSVYCYGTFAGKLVANGSTLTCQGINDLWLAKYNWAGQQLWLKTVSGKGSEGYGEVCMSGMNVIITGDINDTTSIFGKKVPGKSLRALFVAIVSDSGNVVQVKVATAHSSVTSGYSKGLECASDGSGNVYMLASAGGSIQLDGYAIGSTYSVIKMDHNLKVLYVSTLTNCASYCRYFYDLHVSPQGNAYVISKMDYGPNGSDAEYGSIHYLNSAGAQVKVYNQTRRGSVSDIDLDSCNNVYFCGYQRTAASEVPWKCYLTTGQLSPTFDLHWLREDSSYFYCSALSILATSINRCFINGTFDSQLALKDTLKDITPTWPDNYFLGRLNTTIAIPVSVSQYGKQYLCTGKPAVLTASATGAVQWYAQPTGSTVLHTGKSYTLPPQPAGSYTYYASSGTCSMSTVRTPLTFSIFPNPTVQVNPGFFCLPNSFTLSPLGAAKYYYSSGSAVVTPTKTTTYTITGESTSGCIDIVHCTVTLTTAIQPTILTSINFMCRGETATLTCNGVPSYTWNTGHQSMPITISPTVHTIFSVTSKDANGCVSAGHVTQFVTDCVGLSETPMARGGVFPNPSSGIFKVSFRDPTSYVVTDFSGKIIREGTLKDDNAEIDLSENDNGIYLLRLSNGRSHLISVNR